MSASSSVASSNSARARRLRAASPGVHGGASSLLRLARQGDNRLPPGAAISGWAERAAAMLDLTPMMVGVSHAAAAARQPTMPAHRETIMASQARAS